MHNSSITFAREIYPYDVRMQYCDQSAASRSATTYVGHEGLQVHLVRLSDDPVSVATKGPTRDGAHECLLVRQTADQVGDELRQVRHHPIDTTCNSDDQPLVTHAVVTLATSRGARLAHSRYICLSAHAVTILGSENCQSISFQNLLSASRASQVL